MTRLPPGRSVFPQQPADQRDFLSEREMMKGVSRNDVLIILPEIRRKRVAQVLAGEAGRRNFLRGARQHLAGEIDAPHFAVIHGKARGEVAGADAQVQRRAAGAGRRKRDDFSQHARVPFEREANPLRSLTVIT